MKQHCNLSGKNIVVTGGVGILGRELCKEAASLGANLAIVDLDQNVASDFAQTIQGEFKTKAIGLACDVANPQQVAAMVATVVDAWGTIDVLFNNAASKSKDLNAFFAPFEEYDLEEWRNIMAVNIDGVFLVAQAVGKQMVKQNCGGSIIQTASIYGVVAPDQRIYKGSEYLGRQINTPAVYAASKFAVVGLTKYLASYWASHNIRVNCVSPGGIESGQNDMFKARYSNRVPLGRMATATEIASAFMYLASDAASYVTGQNIVVDGGLSCW